MQFTGLLMHSSDISNAFKSWNSQLGSRMWLKQQHIHF